MSQAKQAQRRLRQTGATLLEVLAALLVVSVGLLGIAAIQSVAMADTQNAGMRAQIAAQASALAMAMQANHAFWGTGAAPATFSVQAGKVMDGTGVLNTQPPNCLAAAQTTGVICSPAQLAAFDVQWWANSFNQITPGAGAQVQCLSALPVTCTLTLQWSERLVSTQPTQSRDSAATSGMRSYTLYVAP